MYLQALYLIFCKEYPYCGFSTYEAVCLHLYEVKTVSKLYPRHSYCFTYMVICNLIRSYKRLHRVNVHQKFTLTERQLSLDELKGLLVLINLGKYLTRIDWIWNFSLSLKLLAIWSWMNTSSLNANSFLKRPSIEILDPVMNSRN